MSVQVYRVEATRYNIICCEPRHHYCCTTAVLGTPPRLMPVQMYRACAHGAISSVVCQNMIDYRCSAVLWTRFPPPFLCLYKCIELSVHGTIPSAMCQNMMITAVLLYFFGPPPPPPDLCLYKCKELEFRVRRYLREWLWENNKYR